MTPMDKKAPHVNIHDALQLDGNPDVILDYYAKWSKSYDEDVIENYYGIDYICQILDKHLRTLSFEPASVQIADIGCGTGLLGKPLHALGYTQLDGIDLSPEMTEKAKQTGFYQQLFSGINLNQSIPAALRKQYDATICIGTFTPGHVRPEALIQMLDLTKSGGLIVLSTRIPYYDTTQYQQVSDQLICEQKIDLVQQYMNAPYRDDGDAHYWAYRVLN